MKKLKNKDFKFFLIMSFVTYIVFNLTSKSNDWFDFKIILQVILESIIATIAFHCL